MDGFERRKAQSREDILRAAEDLFSRFGADRVSLSDVARKAGVSQATIYNNFGSKENLVRDYHATIVKRIASRFRGIVSMKKSWVDKFQGFLQSWIDIADRYRFEVGGSGESGVSADSGEAQAHTTIDGEIETSIREFVKEGRENGSLRPDLSDEAIMTYVKFFRQGVANNPAIHERLLRDSGFSEDILSLFVYGVAGRRG